MTRRKRLILYSILLAVASIALVISEATIPSWREIKEQRRAFLRTYNNAPGLLTALENREFRVLFEHLDDAPRQYDIKQFWTIEPAKSELASLDNAGIAERLTQFVIEHRAHRFPLFESNVLHSPILFLSGFGTGFCDDAATLLMNLAKQYGLNARTLWLADKDEKVIHVVTEIFHDHKWRIYDPDNWGVIRGADGMAVDLAELQASIQSGSFEFPMIWRSVAFPQPATDQSRNHSTSTTIEAFKGESWLLFDGLYMLSSDGRYPIGGWSSPAQFLDHYRSEMGTMVRIIPVKDSEPIKIESLFPVFGLFVRFSSNSNDGDHCKTAIKLDSDTRLWERQYRSVCDFPKQELNHHIYYDLSSTLRVNAVWPTQSVEIHGGAGTDATTTSNYELISVHSYSRSNLAR